MKNSKYLDKVVSKKQQNVKLNNILIDLLNEIDISDKTVQNIRNCNSFIGLVADYDELNYKKVAANSCKNRFCPICSYSRACKNALHIKLMLDYIQDCFKYEFIFLTLTVPNCSGFELRSVIKRMNDAFHLLFKYKALKSISEGYIKKLEVTYNKVLDSYHPHFHILIAVNKNYFNDSRKYISHALILQLWQKAYKDSSITQVNIKKANPENVSMELAKYISKDSNYLYSSEVFKNIYNGLKHLKEFSFSGVFKDSRILLKNGKLDKYKTLENINWYWFIKKNWDKDKYNELEKRKLTKGDCDFLGLDPYINFIELD